MGDITQNLTLTLYVFLPTRVLGGGNVWSHVGQHKKRGQPQVPQINLYHINTQKYLGERQPRPGNKAKGNNGATSCSVM
jgi:hypothetical protein